MVLIFCVKSVKVVYVHPVSVRVFLSVSFSVHVHIDVHVHAHVGVHVRMHLSMHVRVYTSVRVCVRAMSVSVFMFMCESACFYGQHSTLIFRVCISNLHILNGRIFRQRFKFPFFFFGQKIRRITSKVTFSACFGPFSGQNQ